MIKVLYYFRNEGSYMFEWQIQHIVSELRDNNIQVDLCNPLDYENFDQANEAVCSIVKNENYDLFFTCHSERTIYVDTIMTIKRYGVPTVLFCPDNLLAPYLHQTVAPLFDLVWLTSYENSSLFKKWGCKTIILPYAANPKLFQPCIIDNEIPELAFVGSLHSSRAYRVNQLTKHQVPVTVFSNQKKENECVQNNKEVPNYFRIFRNYIKYPIGRKLMLGTIKEKISRLELERNEFLYQEASVPFDKMSEINSKYALMLSFTDAKSTGVLRNPVPLINLRHFEIPMAGGLQFTTYCRELADYFEEDKEIILAQSREEYIEKARFYLKPENETLRKQMKAAARKRAENEHTWMNRFARVFQEMDIRY